MVSTSFEIVVSVTRGAISICNGRNKLGPPVPGYRQSVTTLMEATTR